ncbi:MAG: DUF365 domain-containing protein [Methanobacterium sp.]
MEFMAITRPLPTEYAERIYNGKTVFVGKSYPRQAAPGDKFILYESHGERAYTGWADIKTIEELKPSDIPRKYGKELIISPEELKEYAKNRQKMTIIELENFEKFKTPVKPERFVSISGKYIYKDEYEMILDKKG